MNAQCGDTLRLRTGVRRIIPRWEFGHLRVLGRLRMGAGVALTVCGLLTLSVGGNGWKTYGFAALFLALAALTFAVGYWQITIARSAPPRS
jgi:hypothetical protein